MDDNFVQLHVVYEDLPDLVELAVSVRHGGWSAQSTAYDSPSAFEEDARRLLEWVSSPVGTLQVTAGADTGTGLVALRFYVIDRAGHARCAVTLATRELARDARPEETRRFAIEVPTELGSVERFARECAALGSGLSRSARLCLLPA